MNNKIGLVLSGGGTRGVAHLGVLSELEKADIKVDAIAGCSIGSIVGAFYAAGKTIKEILDFTINSKIYKLVNLSVSTLGISKTLKMQKVIMDFIGVTTFEELKIPLYITALNISKGKEIVFSKGDLWTAIRASISVPGLFAPIKIKNDYYIDGAVAHQHPFSAFPKKINKYIIVNVSPYSKLNDDNMNLMLLLETSIKYMQNEISRLHLEKLDRSEYVLVSPKLGDHGMLMTKKHFKNIFDLGVLAAQKKITEIKKKIK